MGNIGIDIIEIERLAKAILTWGERFLQRVFTPAEIAAFSSKTPSLAARFAAKEAVIKVLGKPLPWKDIEVLADAEGAPLVNLYAEAAEQAKRLGLSEVNVSLSHCHEYAVAVAVANRKESL